MSKLEHPSLVSWPWCRRTPAASTRTRPSCPCARAAPPPTTGCCAPPPPGTMTSLRSWTHHPPHCIGILCLPKIQYSPFPSQGACGCGTEPNPPDFWTKAKVVSSVTIEHILYYPHQFTAAGNAMLMDPGNPTNSWCMPNCGQCYRLCTTGGNSDDEASKLIITSLQIWPGTHNGEPAVAGECVVVQMENRCGDGYGEQVQSNQVETAVLDF